MQGVERNKVRLLAHDENWYIEFLEAKALISRLWRNNILDVQHIGSTAIRGIYAKPILDIAVVLRSFQKMDVEAMKDAGYDFCGPQNPDNSRYLFVLRGNDDISLHHLHCYEQGDDNLNACIAFRDYLNNNPEEAVRYSNLKIALAQLYPNDRIAYSNEKEAYIRAICQKALTRQP